MQVNRHCCSSSLFSNSRIPIVALEMIFCKLLFPPRFFFSICVEDSSQWGLLSPLSHACVETHIHTAGLSDSSLESSWLQGIPLPAQDHSREGPVEGANLKPWNLLLSFESTSLTKAASTKKVRSKNVLSPLRKCG